MQIFSSKMRGWTTLSVNSQQSIWCNTIRLSFWNSIFNWKRIDIKYCWQYFKRTFSIGALMSWPWSHAVLWSIIPRWGYFKIISMIHPSIIRLMFCRVRRTEISNKRGRSWSRLLRKTLVTLTGAGDEFIY